MVSFSVARAVALASALPIVFVAAEAGACGGPCTSPLLWDVLQGEGGPLVAANFGLLPEAAGRQDRLRSARSRWPALQACRLEARAQVDTDVAQIAKVAGSAALSPRPRSNRAHRRVAYAMHAAQGEMQGD